MFALEKAKNGRFLSANINPHQLLSTLINLFLILRLKVVFQAPIIL